MGSGTSWAEEGKNMAEGTWEKVCAHWRGKAPLLEAMLEVASVTAATAIIG